MVFGNPGESCAGSWIVRAMLKERRPQRRACAFPTQIAEAATKWTEVPREKGWWSQEAAGKHQEHQRLLEQVLNDTSTPGFDRLK